MRIKFTKLYLFLLPLLSLLAIPLGAFRIADGLGFTQYFLLFILLLDLCLITLYINISVNRYVVILLALLVPPLIVGLINNEFSRRHITDFLVPLVFFMKISIFHKFWSEKCIVDYLNKYVKITVTGSFLLVFSVYFVFSYYGTSRIAILAPLEIGAALYSLTNPLLFVLVFALIIAYGKRAQLVAVLVTLLFSYRFLALKLKMLFVVIMPLFLFGVVFYIANNPENMSVSRIIYSYDLLTSGDFGKLSAGRFDEVYTILSEMSFIDYIFGKGNGYTYIVYGGDGVAKHAANAHFTPLAFLSKYGVFFTLYVYYYIIKLTLMVAGKSRGKLENVLFLSILIFILESFFSYALFVIPVIPVLLGAIYSIASGRRKSIFY